MPTKSNIILSLLFAVLLFFSVDAAEPAANSTEPDAAAGKGSTAAGVFDITKYGAKPGAGDIAEALTSAFKEACASTTPSKVVIPKGSFTLLFVKLEGPCKAPMEFVVEGTVSAPPDPAEYKDGKDSILTIQRIKELTFKGVGEGGVFDGQGAKAWEQNDCKKNKQCTRLPYNLRFNFLTNSRISHITSKDSKSFNILVFACNNVTLEDITITNPKESPNTDGIHLGKSENINITGAKIAAGDDCLSISPGVKQLRVENVECGPGHGISVGSLGGGQNEPPVEGVFVKNCTFTNTDNGVRVKSWLGSHETAATDLHFEDITVDNVTTPIVIDQGYCPSNHCPAKEPSKVKVSNVSYKRIKGTAGGPSAIKIICSSTVPCENVELEDIDLTSSGGAKGPLTSECANVKPKTSGKLNPAPCTQPAASGKPTPDAAAATA
ncbi:hypothetical protein Ancab_022749 [Ancistrocladus abbreviatus]